MGDKAIYKIPLLAVLLILIVAFHPACNSFDADYERDNPIDPRNPVFVHSKPDRFTVTVEGEEINVKWKDNTDYNDGYRVEKAINDSTQFELFASLPKDAEGFLDSSRKIGVNTFYRISMILIENGDERIIHSEILSLSVELINGFDIYSNNFSKEINLQWAISNVFVDGLRIEEKSLLDSTYTTIIDLDHESNFQEINHFNFSSDIESFQTKVRIVAYQYHGDKKVDIDYSDKILYINGITNVGVTFITETETLISWSGNYDFADYYLLEVIRNNVIVDQWEMPPTGSFTLDMPNSPGWSQYMITGKHESIESNRHGRAIRYFYNAPTMSVVSNNLDEVHISWTDPAAINNGMKPSRFTVERSTNNFSFEEIAVLPVDQFSYVDRDLDPVNTYKYRVQTMTSSSIELRIRNMNMYTVTDEEDFLFSKNSFNSMNFQFFDEQNAAIYGRNQNLYPVTLLNIVNLSVRNNLSPGNNSYDFTFTPDGNRAAELVNSSTLGGYDLNIWNMQTLMVEEVLRDVYINTTLPIPLARARFCPSGEYIAIGELGAETLINFWNPVSGEIENTLKIPEEELRAFFFNPRTNEIIVFTPNWILTYDLTSLEKNGQIPINIHIDYRNQLLFSKDGKYLIYNSSFQLYKIDIDSGNIVNKISFNHSISTISSNKDISEIIVQTNNGNFLLNAESFEILQTIRQQFSAQGQTHMYLNQFLDHTAISIRSMMTDNQWKLEKWQRRPHWYVTNPH